MSEYVVTIENSKYNYDRVVAVFTDSKEAMAYAESMNKGRAGTNRPYYNLHILPSGTHKVGDIIEW